MTKKEVLIERVEIAAQIYEIIKVVPVNERGPILGMLEQFQQEDWNNFYKSNSNMVNPGLCEPKDSSN